MDDKTVHYGCMRGIAMIPWLIPLLLITLPLWILPATVWAVWLRLKSRYLTIQ